MRSKKMTVPGDFKDMSSTINCYQDSSDQNREANQTISLIERRLDKVSSSLHIVHVSQAFLRQTLAVAAKAEPLLEIFIHTTVKHTRAATTKTSRKQAGLGLLEVLVSRLCPTHGYTSRKLERLVWNWITILRIKMLK